MRREEGWSSLIVRDRQSGPLAYAWLACELVRSGVAGSGPSRDTRREPNVNQQSPKTGAALFARRTQKTLPRPRRSGRGGLKQLGSAGLSTCISQVGRGAHGLSSRPTSSSSGRPSGAPHALDGGSIHLHGGGSSQQLQRQHETEGVLFSNQHTLNPLEWAGG